MSSAEQLAAEYEQDGGPEITGSSGKRTKAERVEHKHSNPGNDTRKCCGWRPYASKADVPIVSQKGNVEKSPDAEMVSSHLKENRYSSGT
ncbi:hypothetical protein ANCDUO_09454 [Ancylostoma duodenale]|uniref:Uncharacterized protein n=1 Tax=Ancylostoma duodenale TaxID=51022 RepID=A0A0C2DD00_9BILA|nr:hypothetical protein ANCDUO_09454 [Ancylostoma duodenale]